MANPESFELDDPRIARSVFGHRDEFLRHVEEELTVDVNVRGSRVSIEGDPLDAALARTTIEQLYALARRGYTLSGPDVQRTIEILREDPRRDVAKIFLDQVLISAGSRSISPKTAAQKTYVDAIRNHDIVFGVGPAGTGKTYLAMAMAVSGLMSRQFKRIIITRPAVEAGERLGFLPGDLQEKVSPYLRPIYDALHDMLDADRAAQMLERGVIEVAPLAFMRGRTLNASFVVLDEAQNTTREQMKMFLTRLGYDSKAVITGDLTQIDLAAKGDSGLANAVTLLSDIEGISVQRFSRRDVVRHPLVRRIIAAYERESGASDDEGRGDEDASA